MTDSKNTSQNSLTWCNKLWFDAFKNKCFSDKDLFLKELQHHPEWLYQVDTFQQTLLIAAARRGMVEVMKALIEAGANYNAQDILDETALMGAIKGGHEEAVKALIQAGADLNLQDQAGNTALIKAVLNNNEKLIRLLMEAGALLNIKNEDGETALVCAASRSHVKCVRELLSGEKTAWSDQDKTRWIALMTSAIKGGLKGLEVVKMIIDKGVTINRQNQAGWTVLMTVCYHSNTSIDMLDVLLKAGARQDICNKDNKTALDLARERKHDTIVNFLEAEASQKLLEKSMGQNLSSDFKRSKEGQNDVKSMRL